eukprot:811722-Pelagomonas_calceolata.AAC.1
MSFGDTSSLQNALDAFCREEEAAPQQPFSLGPEMRCAHTASLARCAHPSWQPAASLPQPGKKHFLVL